MELVQVRLIVSDFSRMFRFYRDVMGFTPQVDDERGPYAKLSPPDGKAAVALHARSDFEAHVQLAPRAEGASDAALLVFKVSDVDAKARDLGALGVGLVSGPKDAWGRLRVAYLRDPEGNLIELQEWRS